MRPVLTVALSILLHTGFAQARPVINSAVISLQNNVSLVVDNPDNLALGQAGKGYIASDGGGNLVIWSIGAGNGGLFLLPFGTAADYLPVTFRATGGTPEGTMVFGTYAIPPADTTADLPPDVTNLNLAGVDRSGKFANRFWQIAPQGYTSKPTLTDLTFTYSDGDYAPPKNISETNLMARRWNNVLDTWDDFLPVSTLNAAANTLTIASIPADELFDWWAMADAGLPLPVTLINFEARDTGSQQAAEIPGSKDRPAYADGAGPATEKNEPPGRLQEKTGKTRTNRFIPVAWKGIVAPSAFPDYENRAVIITDNVFPSK